MNHYNLSEVVVEAERGNLAGGMMQTRQKVGMFLGEKDTLDVPLHEVTFTKEALDIYSQPGRGMLDTLALDPAVRASHGSMDTSVSIRGLLVAALTAFVTEEAPSQVTPQVAPPALTFGQEIFSSIMSTSVESSASAAAM